MTNNTDFEQLYYLFAVLKTGVVNEAKGSAYIELRQTKIICAV